MYSVRLMSKVRSCPNTKNSPMLQSTAAARQAAAKLHSRLAVSHTTSSVPNAQSAV